jgi:uncharacterized coiled-coil protein SlyX
MLLFFVAFSGFSAHHIVAQTTNQDSLSQQIQRLTDAMARTQAQLEQSQAQLDEMRKQLAALQSQMAQDAAATVSPATSSSSAPQVTSAAMAAEIRDIREHQSIQASQIATHEQAKVESESKYPIKITGLLLLNGFVNTKAVDMPATPTLALPGTGSTGASLRQTILGFDARGPHLAGASSHADLRVDFDGSPQLSNGSTNYTGSYTANATFLRLRTAHAALQWDHTEVYFSLDRPIFSPDSPTSLTAVAEPALAWSGNLWTWNPQLGVTHTLGVSQSHDVQLQAALIDVGDAPGSLLAPSTTSMGTFPGTAEQSHWPGLEARVSLLGSKLSNNRNHLGVGGYFAPNRTSLGHSFNAWAGTLDAQLFLPARLQLTGNFYRGLALGNLGGGAYKDFAYHIGTDSGSYYLRPLNDVGGWAQLKEKVSERLEFNAAFGMDNVFSNELRHYAVPGGSIYQNLAINRTYTGNVIYSPSAYLLFSLEYRHLESLPIIGLPASSNIIGVGAGYKF